MTGSTGISNGAWATADAQAAGTPIRVVIADDQRMVREGLAALLNLEKDIEIVAQLEDGSAVVPTVAETGADIALLDIEMPHVDGIAAAQALQEAGSDCGIVIVTTFGRAGYLQRAMAAGARGFVVKDAPAEELAAALRTVAGGGYAIDPQLAAQALQMGPNPLTEREGDVLRLALSGATVKSMAAQLYLSQGTVRNHLSAAIGKTGARTRTEAAQLARARGWI
ncbi:response regulator [Actinotignum sanguinis]|uniref:Response regulator transcription factor n=1 Tax=Schaalia turicensis TaxID=131111 RepID=A0ABZ0RDR5_9ACTO|nr:response regulator transcription factor [Actinotignum sanguinis]WPJ89311.1 response regulator transcription factor [Schaalia turicensis]MDE1552310.1 response regulator transcription factor [Actinotignum sanguinis]MDE1565018.1 response regulator transcription factor [Actinotignum sanguinis]MDE1577299.1 response regulator transcription factor [Actinotignum sanguinis]MDE1641816.1 response regulator transcription factor [Actinotignum sanguinis]